MRFSRPMTTSRLRRPMSASMQTTRRPEAARAAPMFAVAVVFPTPPLPDVIVATLAVIRWLRLPALAPVFVAPTLGDQLAFVDPHRLRLWLAAPLRGSGDLVGNAQLHGRQVERAHDRAFVAGRPGMDRAAQAAPHDYVSPGDDLGPGVDVAAHDHVAVEVDAVAGTQGPVHQQRFIPGHFAFAGFDRTRLRLGRSV